MIDITQMSGDELRAQIQSQCNAALSLGADVDSLRQAARGAMEAKDRLEQLKLQATDAASQSAADAARALTELQALGAHNIETTHALLADASSWVQHFSVVRMTVGTFLIGIAFGIVAAKWNDYHWSLLVPVWSLFGLAFFFIWKMTGVEAARVVVWKNNLNLLLAHQQQWKSIRYAPTGRSRRFYELYPGEVDHPMISMMLAAAVLGAISVAWSYAPQEPTAVSLPMPLPVKVLP